MSGYIRIIRIYGMEGGSAEEGEAKTRILKSSYRRWLSHDHTDRLPEHIPRTCRRFPHRQRAPEERRETAVFYSHRFRAGVMGQRHSMWRWVLSYLYFILTFHHILSRARPGNNRPSILLLLELLR